MGQNLTFVGLSLDVKDSTKHQLGYRSVLCEGEAMPTHISNTSSIFKIIIK